MSSNHPEFSVVALIDSKDTDRANFGSAFLICQDKQATYWLTCAHVITDVGGSEQTLVDGFSIKLVAPGEEQLATVRSGRDLAIVSVEGFLDKEPLKLCEAASKGKRFVIVGYSQKDKARFITQISGYLGKSTEINLKGNRTPAWYLEIDGSTKDILQPGYSGSPVIDQETGYVIGVVTQREGEKQGIAIAIESLKEISGNLPIQFLKADDLQNSLDPDSKKNLALTAASNELEQLRQDRQRFFEERKLIELKIQYIEIKIQEVNIVEERKAIELKIQDLEIKIQELNIEVEDDGHDPGRTSLLQKLQKQSELAKKYGDLALNKFPLGLKETIEMHPEDLDYFYLDIETCINRLYWTLNFNDVAAVDDIMLKLSLGNRSRYGDQGSDAYLELFKLLRKGLAHGTSGESKDLLLQGLDSIEEQISLFS